MTKEFATAINCMDGRVQKPVTEYIQKNFDVDYVDMITEPGPSKILSEGKDIDTIESLRKRVKISAEKHKSQIVAIVAHYDCAGSPEDEDVQKEYLKKAVSVVFLWGFSVKKIIALWVDKNFQPSIVG